MGRNIMAGAVSLDGFIAREDDSVGPLFDFYRNGDVEYHLGDERRVFRSGAATAALMRELTGDLAAGVQGRRLFDLTDGWHGRPAGGERVFVVTHSEPTDWAHYGRAPFTFVTAGVRRAVELARAYAGDRDVGIMAGDVGGQALRAGLVDRVVLHLVPVVFGTGRPFFGAGGVPDPIRYGNPRVVEGDRVTHLVYDLG